MSRRNLTADGERPPAARRNRDVEITNAAIQVFSQKGYSAASLQDVADRVGLLKGSLYHYIDSKESLLFRILQETHKQAEQIMSEVDALELPVADRLYVYVERIALWYLANLERASLYLSEWRYLEGDYAEAMAIQRRAFDTYMRGIITEAHESGATRADLDTRLATSFVISAIGSIPTWFRTSPPSKPPVIARELAKLTLSTVFGEAPTHR